MYIQTNHAIKNPCISHINKIIMIISLITIKNMIYLVLNIILNF